MSKVIPLALATHFAKPTSPVRCCLEVVRRDGFTLRAINWDQNFEIDGDTYRSSFGGTLSDVAASAALNVDNSEMTGRYLLTAINERDIRAGLWDHATYRRFLVNPLDASMGIYSQQDGKCGQITCDRLTFVAELRGLMEYLQQSFGRSYTLLCPWKTFSEECGLSVGSVDDSPPGYIRAGRLDSVSDDGRVLYDADRTEPGPAGGIGITAITNANPAVITTATALGLPTGSVITLSDIDDMPALNGTWIMRAVSGATFAIDIDTTEAGIFGTYGSGGTATPQGAESGYFDGGPLTIGNITRIVKSYVPGQFVLQDPFPFELTGHEEYTVTVGDDHTFNTCRMKFANVNNFGGFPYISGNDHRVQVGRRA